MPSPTAGELAIRALWVSVNPYLMVHIPAGKVANGRIRSRTIAKDEQSYAPGFAPWDVVLGFPHWQVRECVPAAEMRLLHPCAPYRLI